MIRLVAGDRTGVVILRDRKADGSHVLLECTEFVPSGGGGVLGLPSDDEEFPMLAVQKNTEMYAEKERKQPFRLEIDLTEMPPGELRFNNREFIEEAVASADAEKIRLSPEDASRWGWIRRRHAN